MIKYPEDLYIDKHMEFKIGKERLKLLEKTLRLIGNFDKNKPIVIEEYEVITYKDIIFKIKDKNNTIFSFISMGLSDSKDEGNKRYNQSYHLTMETVDSDFKYKYKFYNMEGKLSSNIKLEVIEIEYKLSDTRKLKIKRERYHSINLEIEEQDKRYVICIYNNYKSIDDDEHDIPLLENLETLIEEIKNLKKTNLENTINITQKKVGISGCRIYYKDERIASIDFLGNQIKSYSIKNQNSSIETNIYKNKIERKTERKIDQETIKTEETLAEDNYEIIQSDMKKILKLM